MEVNGLILQMEVFFLNRVSGFAKFWTSRRVVLWVTVKKIIIFQFSQSPVSNYGNLAKNATLPHFRSITPVTTLFSNLEDT